MKMTGNSSFEEIEMVAVITRADGRVEHLGSIAYWHRNPFIRIWRRFKHSIKKLYK
jgi:hypothetical protein